MTPRDEVSFSWLRLLGVLEIAPSGRDLMYEVESLQIYRAVAVDAGDHQWGGPP